MVRDRKVGTIAFLTAATIEIRHGIIAAPGTQKFVTFDPNTHEVMAGDDVFHY
ncbi:MAG: hypothetical protein ACNA8K_16025 [Cyclonatronaceae bacterium]